MFSFEVNDAGAAQGGASAHIAFVTMDAPDASVNTVSTPALEAFERVLDQIEQDARVRAIVLRSGKKDSFVVGADVHMFAAATDAAQLEAIVRRGHATLARLARMVPVVAAIHGECLGAGLELCLACDARVASSSGKTSLGLPEVMLGLFPGAGGLSRLPRMIGVRQALDLILTGRSLRAKKSLKAGLVDEVVAPEGLLQAATRVALKLATKREKRGARARVASSAFERAEQLAEQSAAARAIVFKKAREQVLRKTHGLYPAPLVALDVMQRGLKLPLERALELEPPAFATLALGDVSKALVSLFVRSKAMKPSAAQLEQAARVERLGMVGGGFMGADIAVVAAQAGMQTVIRDVDAAALSRALGHVRGYFDRRAKSAGAAAVFDARARVSGRLDLAGFERADLIIEAVPEQLALKQRVFAELEERVPASTVLATNTSALPLAGIGATLRDPSRFVGLHFFSPVPKMPLLEIVRHEHTSDKTLATAMVFAQRIKKTPIVVRDGAGFYTTRILGYYLMAAMKLLRAGHRIEDLDDGARRVGWPVGPMALLDEVGIDVGAKVAHTLHEHFPARFELLDGVDAFLAEGRLGRKSGRGMYVYPKPGEKGRKRPDEQVYAMIPDRSAAPPSVSNEHLGELLTLCFAMDAMRCLEEGVIANADDGDIGAVFGLGYPPMTGGPFSHADRRGAAAVLDAARRAEQEMGPIWSPPQSLIDLAASGGRFRGS